MTSLVYFGEANAMADHAARKYHGSVATGYDAKRDQAPKWKAEQTLLEGIIAQLPKGTRVLDVPVGTGRLIPAYERADIEFLGMDISEDMLKEAASKITEGNAKANLARGSVTDMSGIADDAADVSFMIRLTRWLSTEDRRKALHQLGRVTRSVIYLTARITNHAHVYPLEAISKDCPDGWKVSQAWQIGDDKDYVLVEVAKA